GLVELSVIESAARQSRSVTMVPSVTAGRVSVAIASLAIVVACSTSAAPHKPSIPKPVTAQVASVRGATQIVHSGVRSPLAAGADVTPGDVVEAGPSSTVELGLHGVHVQLGPSSSM